MRISDWSSDVCSSDLPMMDRIGEPSGFPDVFFNLDTVTVLFIAWVVVILSFFVLAVQLFVTLIEFKLTTLAGFVLVPFAFWNKTAFLAEKDRKSVVLGKGGSVRVNIGGGRNFK